MLNAIFRGIGGLASDAVELTTKMGNEILDIPDSISKGWDDGLLIDTESYKAKPKPDGVGSIDKAKAEVESELGSEPKVDATVTKAKDNLRDTLPDVIYVNPICEVNKELVEIDSEINTLLTEMLGLRIARKTLTEESYRHENQQSIDIIIDKIDALDTAKKNLI